MTQEEELFFMDLCGRLCHGIFVEENRDSMDKGPVVYTIDYHPWINDCRPYFRPMESMTEEEKKKYKKLCIEKTITFITWSKTVWYDTWKSLDWLNKKGFDYRGLIPMGLALPAREGMYNIE